MTPAQKQLVQHAIFLADNAQRDLGQNAQDGVRGRPTVAQLNRTLERLASIVTTLAAALKD